MNTPFQTGRWSVHLLLPPFWSCTLSSSRALSSIGLCKAHMVHHQPLLVKLPKSRITAQLYSIIPFCFPTCKTNFCILFNPILPSKCSRQLFTTISSHRQSKTMIFSTIINPHHPTPISPLSNFSVFPPWHFPISFCCHVSS